MPGSYLLDVALEGDVLTEEEVEYIIRLFFYHSVGSLFPGLKFRQDPRILTSAVYRMLREITPPKKGT